MPSPDPADPADSTARRPRIAVFSGPMATITNSAPLVTSNQARARHGLPAMPGADVLRPQRLAAPVTVYVEAYTAHPLEADSAQLSAPPDGWLDEAGAFHDTEPAAGGVPVFVVELGPRDGLLPLPYMGRQADGSPWEQATAFPLAPAAQTRQTFYPDASRVYEEIDRLGVAQHGRSVGLSAMADFDFYRAMPAGGWTGGQLAADRTDIGTGDIAPETLGAEYFAYAPSHLYREPARDALARATSLMASVLASGEYVGAQWLESSSSVEETLYWFALLIDTTVPIVAHTAQRPTGTLSADGPRNIVDGVTYLLSGMALDDDGRDRVGPVLIVDEMVYAAREVTKVDARPGGYTAAGGHGGVVAHLGGLGVAPRVTFLPARRHTRTSQLRLSQLPDAVDGVVGAPGAIKRIRMPVKDSGGALLATAIPQVTLVKRGSYPVSGTLGDVLPDPSGEVEILARIDANLAGQPLAGFVAEGSAPYGSSGPSTSAALAVAAFSGMPVVRVGRGSPGGVAYRTDPTFVAGNNLSATKARILLMATMLKLGALPVAADPYRPTPDEVAATHAAVAAYQEIFDTH